MTRENAIDYTSGDLFYVALYSGVRVSLLKTHLVGVVPVHGFLHGPTGGIWAIKLA